MRTTFILTTAAIALAAGIGSASAGERFATIEGLPIQALSADELAGVRGAKVTLWLHLPGGEIVFPGRRGPALVIESLPEVLHIHGLES